MEQTSAPLLHCQPLNISDSALLSWQSQIPANLTDDDSKRLTHSSSNSSPHFEVQRLRIQVTQQADAQYSLDSKLAINTVRMNAIHNQVAQHNEVLTTLSQQLNQHNENISKLDAKMTWVMERLETLMKNSSSECVTRTSDTTTTPARCTRVRVIEVIIYIFLLPKTKLFAFDVMPNDVKVRSLICTGHEVLPHQHCTRTTSTFIVRLIFEIVNVVCVCLCVTGS